MVAVQLLNSIDLYIEKLYYSTYYEVSRLVVEGGLIRVYFFAQIIFKLIVEYYIVYGEIRGKN